MNEEKTKESIDFDFFRLISKHPFISLFITVMLLIPFGFSQASEVNNISLIYLCAVICLITTLLSFSKSVTGNNKKRVLICMSASICSTVIFTVISITSGYKNGYLFLLSFILIFLFCAVLYFSNNLTIPNLLIMIFIATLALRFIYALSTDSSSRQHDVGFFNWTWGHSNYIEYWYNNGLKLPDFDVRDIWQYYHPPLHHMLMALFLRILTQTGLAYDKACQCLQLLCLLYSSLCILVSYKIFRELKLKGISILIPMLILSFHPIFIIMSGSFNNDILSILFILLSILCTLRWYKEQNMKNIILTALSVGLGMMTKLSVWMIAPAIALVFLYSFIRSNEKKKYIPQFLVFGLISFPLGLWWQTRNYLLFKVPFTYVPNLGTYNPQYLGNMSFISRLFDFSQISYVYDGFPDYGAPEYEVNPILGLFKTACFDEGTNAINTTTFPQINIVGPILFWLSIIIFTVSACLFFYMMLKKTSGTDLLTRMFFLLAFLTFFMMYFIFCYEYPHSCTMNIRYCTPLIIFCLLGLGLFIKEMKEGNFKNIFIRITFVISLLFSLASMSLFILIT